MTRDEAASGRLIEAATALIQERGGTESITTRDIAARAGVGVGLLNYHFQTKENLLNLCTQRIIGDVIGGFEALRHSLDLDPEAKLRALAKQTCRFLATNPGISRTSITHDLLNPGISDNTMQTFRAYLPAVIEACGGRITDGEARVLLHAFIAALQSAFLRGEAFTATTGIDMGTAEGRDRLVDSLLDLLLHKFN